MCTVCALFTSKKKKKERKLQVWQDRKSDILEVKGGCGWIGGATRWHCRFLGRCVFFQLNFNILFVSTSAFSVGDMDRKRSSDEQNKAPVSTGNNNIYTLWMILLWITVKYILFIIALFSKLKYIKTPPHGSSILFRFVQFGG